ncbi:MAG TPA: hypothetical protein EYP08_02910, partial [Pyrodictiaceae archaeon]|nr:hypothetical protein [Pyrodictiaceae archaeon]
MIHKLTLLFFVFFIQQLFADKIDIKAERFYASDINKVAYFEGDAQIHQGKNQFFSDKIIVYFNNSKKAIKYEAIGNVRFDITEKGIHYKGKAEKITYAPNDSKYYFSGDVVLEDLTNNRKIEAEIISLDL